MVKKKQRCGTEEPDQPLRPVDVFTAFVEPLLSMRDLGLSSDTRLAMAAMAWNLTLLDSSRRADALRNALRSLEGATPEQRLLYRKVVDYLVGLKLEFFSAYAFFIVDAKLSMVDGKATISLRVIQRPTAEERAPTEAAGIVENVGTRGAS